MIITPKQYYSTYKADDSWSPLSQMICDGIMSLKPEHVLEFGAGTGKHLNHLNKQGVCTIGIDVSPLNVQKALYKYDLPCIICGDETYLRNLCNVDVVFTVSVLDHIEHIDGIIGEFKRIANKAVYLAETNDVVGEYYFAHDYEAMRFVKLNWGWTSPGDGANYFIWKWMKK